MDIWLVADKDINLVGTVYYNGSEIAKKSTFNSEYVTASTVQSMINAAISWHVQTFHF